MNQNNIKNERELYFPKSLYHSFNEPFIVDRADNVYYYSLSSDIPYIDFYNNVCHIGHSNTRVLDAVQSGYSTINIHTRYYEPSLTNYTKKLFKYLPPNTYKVLFTNSGSESNDLALQIVLEFLKTKKSSAYIGSMKNSYHGTTYLCNMASHLLPTGQPKEIRGDCESKLKFFNFDIYEENELKECDAFILETYQGVGGNIEIPNEFLKKVRDSVDIMICDEVQTGFGRTGEHFWAFQKADIIPDIITCGKSIANGYPMGACIFKKELERYLPPSYFNTFGGNSVACRVASAVLDEIEEKNLIQHCKDMGEYFKRELLDIIDYDDDIVEVSGNGLFLGIHFDEKVDVKRVVEELKKVHIIVGIGKRDNRDIIRIKPPITITKYEIDRFINNLLYVMVRLSNS